MSLIDFPFFYIRLLIIYCQRLQVGLNKINHTGLQFSTDKTKFISIKVLLLLFLHGEIGYWIRKSTFKTEQERFTVFARPHLFRCHFGL